MAPAPRTRLTRSRSGTTSRPGPRPPTPPRSRLNSTIPVSRAGRELRVVAADLGVAERGALLAAAVDRHDRGVQVDRQRPGQISWAGAGRPQPGQQLPADRVELPDVGPLVRPQPRPDRRRAPGCRRTALAAAPARSSAVSSMLSPPASIDPITVSAFAPLFAPCARFFNTQRGICTSQHAGPRLALDTVGGMAKGKTCPRIEDAANTGRGMDRSQSTRGAFSAPT